MANPIKNQTILWLYHNVEKVLRHPDLYMPGKDRAGSLSIRLALRVEYITMWILNGRSDHHSHDHRLRKSQFHGSRHTDIAIGTDRSYSEDYSDEYWGQIGVVQLLPRFP